MPMNGSHSNQQSNKTIELNKPTTTTEDLSIKTFLKVTDVKGIHLLLNEYPFSIINQKQDIKTHVLNIILETLEKEPINNYMTEKYKPPKSKELLKYIKQTNITEDILDLFSTIDYPYDYTSHTAALSLLSRYNTVDDKSIEIYNKTIKYITYNPNVEYNYLNALFTFKILISLIDLQSFIKNEMHVFANLKNEITSFLSSLANQIMKYTSKLSESYRNGLTELNHNTIEFEIENLEEKIFHKKLHSQLKMLFTTLSEFIIILQSNYGHTAIFLTTNTPIILSNFLLTYLQFFYSGDLRKDLGTYIKFETVPYSFIHLHTEPFSKILKFFQFIEYFNPEIQKNRQIDENQILNTCNLIIYGLLPFLINNISNISIYQNLVYNTTIGLSNSDTILRSYFNEALEKNIFTVINLIDEDFESQNPNLQLLVVETKTAFNIRHLLKMSTMINILKKFKYYLLRTMEKPTIKSYKGKIEGRLNISPFMLKKTKDLEIYPTVHNLHKYMMEKRQELPRLHFTHIIQLFSTLNETLGSIQVESVEEKQSVYIEILKLMYNCINDLNRRYKRDLIITNCLNIFDEYREYILSSKYSYNNKTQEDCITEDFIERVYEEYENILIIDLKEKYDTLFTSLLVTFNSIISFINENRDVNSKLPQVVNNIFLLICEEILEKENFTYSLTKNITNTTLHTLCIISTCFLNIDPVSFEYVLKRLINNIMYISSITILFFAIFKKTASTNIFIYNELSEILEKEITKYLNTSHLETYEKNYNDGNEDIEYKDFIIYMFQITSSMLTSFKTYKFLKKISALIELADTEHTLYFECLFTLLADISSETQEKHYLNFTQKVLEKNLEVLNEIHFGEFPITHNMMKKQIETINAFIVYTHTNNLEEHYFRTSMDTDLRNQVQKASGDTGKDFLLQNIHLYTLLTDNLLHLSLCNPENYAIDKIVHTLYPLQSSVLVKFYLYFLIRAIYKRDIYWVSSVFTELFTSKYFMDNKISITRDIESIDVEVKPKICLYFLKGNTKELLYDLSRALDVITDHKLYGELIIKIGDNYIPNIKTNILIRNRTTVDIKENIDEKNSVGILKRGKDIENIFIRDALEYYFNRYINIEDTSIWEEFSIESLQTFKMIYNWKGIESSIVPKYKECERNKHMEYIALKEILIYLDNLKLDYISWMCICSLAYNNNMSTFKEYINKYNDKYDYSCLCLEDSFKCKEKCTEESKITINLFIDSIVLFTNRYYNNINISCLNSIIYTMSLLINNKERSINDLTIKILSNVFNMQFECLKEKGSKNMKKINTTILIQILSNCLKYKYLNTKNNQIAIIQTIKNLFNELVFRIQQQRQILFSKEQHIVLDSTYKYSKEVSKDSKRKPIKIQDEEILNMNRQEYVENNTLNCFECCYNPNSSNTLFLITQKILFDSLFINFTLVSDLLISFLETLKYPLNNYIQINRNIITNRLLQLTSYKSYNGSVIGSYELVLDIVILFDFKQYFDIPRFMFRSINEFLTNQPCELNNRLYFKTLQYLNKIVKYLTAEEAEEYLDFLIKTLRAIYCNKCLDYEIKTKIIEESTIENPKDCEEAIRESAKINPVHFIKDYPSINSYLINLTCHFEALDLKLQELIYQILYDITDNTIHWSIVVNLIKIQPNFFNILIVKNEQQKVPFSKLLLKYFCIQKTPSNELIEIAAKICSTKDDYMKLLTTMRNRDMNFLSTVVVKPVLLEVLVDIYKANNNTILFVMECLNILSENPNNEKLIYSYFTEDVEDDLLYMKYSISCGYTMCKDTQDKVEVEILRNNILKNADEVLRLASKTDRFSRDVCIINTALAYKDSGNRLNNNEDVLGLIIRKDYIVNFSLYSKIDSFYLNNKFIRKLLNINKSYLCLILLTKEFIYNKEFVKHILNLKLNKTIPFEYAELYNMYLAAFMLKHISESTNYGDDKMFYYFFVYVSPYLDSIYEISREVLRYSDTDYNQIIFTNCLDKYYLTLTNDLINRITPILIEIKETCYDQFIEYCKYNKECLIYSLYKLLTAPTLQFRLLSFKLRNIILGLFSTKDLYVYKSIYMDFFMILLIEPKIQFTEMKSDFQKQKLYLNDFLDTEVLPDSFYLTNLSLNSILLSKLDNYCNINAKPLLEFEYKKIQQKRIDLLPFYNNLLINYFKTVSKNREVDYEFIKLLPPNFLIRHSIDIKITGKNFYKIMIVLYEHCVLSIYKYVYDMIDISQLGKIKDIFQILEMIVNLSQALTQNDSIKIIKEDLIMILILSMKLMELRCLLINKQGSSNIQITEDIYISIMEIDFIPFLIELSINKELSASLSEKIRDMFNTYTDKSIDSTGKNILKDFNRDLYKIVFSIIDITETNKQIKQMFKDLEIPFYNKLSATNKITYNSNNCNKAINKSCNCLDLYLFNSINTNYLLFKFMNSKCFSIRKLIFEELLFKKIKNNIKTNKILEEKNLRIYDELLKEIILDLFKYLKVNTNIFLKRNIKWYVLQIFQVYICYIENKKFNNKYYLINNTRDELPIEMFYNLNLDGFVFLRQVLDILYFFNDAEIILRNNISNYLNNKTVNIELFKDFLNTPLKNRIDFLKINILKFDQTNDKLIFTLLNENIPSFEDKHILKYKLNLKYFINQEYELFRKYISLKSNAITFNTFIPPLNYDTSKLYLIEFLDFNEKALKFTKGKDEFLFKELYKFYFQGDGKFPLILNKFNKNFITDKEFLQRFEIIFKNHTNSQYTMNYQYLISMLAKMSCYNENPEYSLELIDRVLQLPFVEGSYFLYHYLYTMMSYDFYYNDIDYKKCINKRMETKFNAFNLHFFNINLPGNVDNKCLYFFQIVSGVWLINRIKKIVYNLEEPITEYLKGRQTQNKSIYKTKTRNEKISLNIIDCLRGQIADIEYLFNCAILKNINCEAWKFYVDLYLFYPVIRRELRRYNIDGSSFYCDQQKLKQQLFEAVRFDNWCFLHLLLRLDQKDWEVLGMYFFKGLWRFDVIAKFILPVFRLFYIRDSGVNLMDGFGTHDLLGEAVGSGVIEEKFRDHREADDGINNTTSMDSKQNETPTNMATPVLDISQNTDNISQNMGQSPDAHLTESTPLHAVKSPSSNDSEISQGSEESTNKDCLLWLLLAFSRETDSIEAFYHLNYAKYDSSTLLQEAYHNPVFSYINSIYLNPKVVEKRVGNTLIRINDSNVTLKTSQHTRIFSIEKYTEVYTKESLERSNLMIDLYMLLDRSTENDLEFQEDLKVTQLRKRGFKVSLSKSILLQNCWLREVGKYELSEIRSLNKLKGLFSSTYTNYRMCLTDLAERYSSVKVLNNMFGLQPSLISLDSKKNGEIIQLNLVLLKNKGDEITGNLLDEFVGENPFTYENIDTVVKRFIKRLKEDGKLEEMLLCYGVDDVVVVN